MTSFAPHSNLEVIAQAIAQLRLCNQVDLQMNWLGWLEPKSEKSLGAHSCAPLPTLCSLNTKGHIAWEKGKKVLWLQQKLVVPAQLQGYPLAGLSLRLALTWWAELAQIYVNDELVQEGDLFDCSARILLNPRVTPGEEFHVSLRLVSPNHDDGALVRSLCLYESNDPVDPEPGFVADELAILQKHLETFEPEQLSTFATAVAQIDWSSLPDKDKFGRSLHALRQNLQSKIQVVLEPHQKYNPKSKIFLLGHAHLDLAWLWAISETWEAAQRTFTSVLNLQQAFPELTFCHSTPALYAWIEQHRPDLFTAIQQQVRTGRWEIVGGLWVEPELNTVSGESIVRQLLYGQRYVQAKFGQISSVAWLPDSFGFCATLPQFLVLGGMEYFVTQKLRWNDTTQFPHEVFWWRSPDGTDILSLMSAPIGEGIDPVKMAVYACDWEAKTQLPQFLWLPGVGDHGGGPTRDMLEVARRWQQSPFFPDLEFTTAEEYLREIQESVGAGLETRPYGSRESGVGEESRGATTTYQLPTTNYPLPIWQNELYLEFHRGCYTSHADQKRYNRRCEDLLYQAELFATLAMLTAEMAYPKTEIEDAWKKVLFNQFHDILPGSAIPEVYVDANQDWQAAEQTATDILNQSLQAIAAQIDFPPSPHPKAQPIVVFNSLNWVRSQVVELTVPNLQDTNWQICNSTGESVQSYISVAEFTGDRQTSTTIISFLAKDIPSIGYRLYWLCPRTHFIALSSQEVNYTEYIIQNEYLRVTVDSHTGDLSSIFDKINRWEVLNGAGNQLQAFQDSGQYWDAWNIDPNYAQHPLPSAELISINQHCDRNFLQSCVSVARKIGQSIFRQDYILETGSPVLTIKTSVDWQERHVMVKAAFPLNVSADYANYEIPCGAISRPTQPQTPAEKAKWEVPALRWADISTSDRGVSLLNDCKYGYDYQSDRLRLTLLRSPIWPDPEADIGLHEFTYALYPHAGTWQQAQTVRHGYELNIPLQVLLLPAATATSGKIPATTNFLTISADNLILMAFKPSEDEPQELILRCYECHGDPARLDLQNCLNLSVADNLDLLERPIATNPADRKAKSISPWKIVTLKLKAR
ncbi:alpha-mannosidase [Chroococcidiopsis sp. FACHB-1243]|uniref:alpha-mannosidase n=1 Tax=Chroococcidiopsis sp. [FACHB-1243] TaxID=2692781 RepID=UPI001784B9AD|nr:alpha-mannosidase [Chroococcidiopsis sp. [FACHB-1243]]MBD2304192.1 alpha-mannosidase [Chroococcidiopsis sp. [FACHB-1243]]